MRFLNGASQIPPDPLPHKKNERSVKHHNDYLAEKFPKNNGFPIAEKP